MRESESKMASIYSKRKILYIGWVEELLSGEKVHRSRSLKLKDTRENRKVAKMLKLQKENSLAFSYNKVQQDITVTEAYQEFMETKSENAKATIEYYEYSLRLLVKDYGNVFVSRLGSKEIKKIVNQYKGLSKESIISYRRGMKIFFNFLIQKKYISENPVGKIEKTRNRNVEVMTDEELTEILKYFKNRNIDHYNLIKFLVLTGFRISEAISLYWVDIKNDYIIIKNKKGKRRDIFPITDEIREHVRNIPNTQNREHVFHYSSVSSARHLGRKISKLTNGRYSFHSFRKKFGTECAKTLMPAELKEVMRHNDIRTTMEFYVGLNIIKIGEKLTEAKRKLVEQETVENCQIFNIKNAINA